MRCGGRAGGGAGGTDGRPKSDAIEVLNGPPMGKKGGGGGRRCINSMSTSLERGVALV